MVGDIANLSWLEQKTSKFLILDRKETSRPTADPRDFGQDKEKIEIDFSKFQHKILREGIDCAHIQGAPKQFCSWSVDFGNSEICN